MTGRMGLATGLMAAALGWSQPASPPAVLGRLAFSSTPYHLRNWRGDQVPLQEHDRRGPKARGHLWDWEARTDEPGTGGHVRFRWWQYRVANPGSPGDRWEDNAGFYFRGSALEPASGWHEGTEYFGRVRIRMIEPMRPETSVTGASVNNKWLIANADHRDGDHRLMVHLTNIGASEPCTPSSRRYPPASYTAIRISKNIGDQCAAHVLRTGEWEDVQWSWRMGPKGQAFVRLWVNNNDYGRPTSQHVLSEPWIQDRAGMNGGWQIGGYFSDELEADASWDLDDFEIATAFDAMWARRR